MFSKKLHKKYFRYIENKLSGKRDTFVLIGHPKSLQNEKLFKQFITTAKRQNNDFQFKTLSEYYESII
jgi:putative aminopeptidase FrvX